MDDIYIHGGRQPGCVRTRHLHDGFPDLLGAAVAVHVHGEDDRRHCRCSARSSYLVVDPSSTPPVDLLGVCVLALCVWVCCVVHGLLALDRSLYIRERGGDDRSPYVREDRGNIDEFISFSFHQKGKESRRINQQIKAAIIQQLPLPRYDLE